MAMDVAEYPYLSLIFVFDLLHEVLDTEYLWVKEWLRVDPLSVKIYTSRRVTVVATDHSIRVHAWNQYKCVEPPQISRLSTVRGDKVENTSEHLTARCLSRVDTRCDQDNLVLFLTSVVSADDNLVKGDA